MLSPVTQWMTKNSCSVYFYVFLTSFKKEIKWSDVNRNGMEQNGRTACYSSVCVDNKVLLVSK